MLFIFLFNVALVLTCSYILYVVIGRRIVNWLTNVGKSEKTENVSENMNEEK
jgi:hypothetical protein